MRRGLLLLLLGVLVGVAACASPSTPGSHVRILESKRKVETTRGEIVQPAKTEEERKQDERCKHAWDRHAWHLTEDATGPGATQICVVSRCTICGEIRHECTKRRRAP